MYGWNTQTLRAGHTAKLSSFCTAHFTSKDSDVKLLLARSNFSYHGNEIFLI